MEKQRHPFPIPFGWFSLGRIDELPDDDVFPVTAFDEELVVWRDAAGERHVAEAWCPHLGAHLGHGGRVEDDCVVCPFHEWRFDAGGSNTAIPYADRPNRKARLRTYPSMVRNRHLLVWRHPDPSVGPTWDIPDVLPEDPVECMRMTRTVRTAWQEIAENSVDMAHFKYVHGTGKVADIGEMTIDGPLRTVRSTQSFQTARGEFEGQIESNSYGPGVGTVRFTLMSTVTMVTAVTAMGTNEVTARFTMYHEAGDDLAAKIGTGFGNEVMRQFDQDMPIWEHKRFQPSPALAPTEKPITEFRSWARQFYAEGIPVR
jgi:phenylpropionate dioxygenase-like ring-hydroxylating dioxygenase large terminal subunit